MNMWFISDTHWGHSNIIRFCSRPFSSVEEMNEKLIENWNEVVKPEDTVWHLGDFAFFSKPKIENVLSRLNGNKHLILGNHDQEFIKHREEILSNKLLSSIRNYAEVKIDKKLLVLFHYGQRVWNKSHHGSIHLYGHSHGTLPPFGKSVDVGVDCKEITNEYRPIHLDEVIRYMDNRVGEVVDHHGQKEKEIQS